MITPDAEAGTAPRPVILFVLGINRSGTSALTRVLSLCGGALPAKLLGAMPDNPLGHWEPRQVNVLNEGILRRLGSSAFDPSLHLRKKMRSSPKIKPLASKRSRHISAPCRPRRSSS